MVALVIGISILIFFMINAIGNPIDILLADAALNEAPAGEAAG